MNGLLTGEHKHKIDSQGRMILPATFRDAIGERIVITKGLDNCLWVRSAEDMDLWIKNTLSKLPEIAGRSVIRYFVGSMAACEIDDNGRFVVPQELREYAKISNDVPVMVVGQLNKIELWNKVLLNEYNEKISNTVASILENAERGTTIPEGAEIYELC